MSTKPTIDTNLKLDGVSKTAAELKAFAGRVRAMSNEVTRAARAAGGALRRAFGPQTNAAIVATAGNLALVRKELRGISAAAAQVDARLSGIGNGMAGGSGEAAPSVDTAARDAAAAARERAKADARAALEHARTQTRAAAAQARTQAQAAAAAARTQAANMRAANAQASAVAKTQARAAAAEARSQAANVRSRATADAATARAQAATAAANARIRTTEARTQAQAVTAAARAQAANVRAVNARAAVDARTQARAAAVAARSRAAEARSQAQASIAATRAQAQAAAAAARLRAANARDEARATAARVRTEARAAAAAAKVEATRARDAARATTAESQARARATAASVRRVRGALDGVSTSATRVGKRMAVTGAKVLAILAAIAVAGKAAGVAVAGLAGLGAGALVAGGSAALAVNTVNTQQTAAQETGASREKAVGLSGAAKAFGFEDGQAEAAVSSLRDKLRDAAAGGESAALFTKLGVEATDASGKVRDTVDVLRDLDVATKRLSEKDRSKAFSDIFGADGARLQDFMDKGGAASIAAAAERAKSLGAVATDADVAIVRDFRSAIGDLVLSFRALALAVSRQIMPGLTKTTRVLAEWITTNKEVFARSFSAGWDRVMKSMRGAVGVLRIIPAASGTVVRSMHTLMGVFADIGRYIAGDYVSIEKSWVYELMRAIHATIAVLSTLVGSGGGGLVGALARGWVNFLSILTQVWAAFMGLDGVVRHGWILTMRDGVVAIVGIISKLPAYIAALPPQLDAAKAVVLAVIEVIKVAIIESVAALLAFSQLSAEQVMAMVEARIAAFQARVAEAIRPVREAIADIWEVLRDGESAQVESPFVAKIKDELVSLRAVAIAFWESLQKAWAMFRSVLDTIHTIIKPLLDYFGTDPLTMALFLGLLRISGLLGVMQIAVNALIAGFARLFAMGMAGTFGAGLQGFLQGVIGSMGRLATMIPQIAVLAAAAWAGVKAGQYLGQQFYEQTGLQAADDAELEAKFAVGRNNLNALHDRHLAALAAKPKAPDIPVRTGDVLMSDGKTLDMDKLWEMKRGGGSTETVDVNFNVGGRTSTFSGTRSAADDLTRALADARTAGGLR